MNDFEKRWQRISQLLAMEATGKERPMFSSGRTLFGIKSSVEEKMDQFAREIEEEQAAKRKAAFAAARKDPDGVQNSTAKSSSDCSSESDYSPGNDCSSGGDHPSVSDCSSDGNHPLDNDCPSAGDHLPDNDHSPVNARITSAAKINKTERLTENATNTRFVASNAYIRSSIQELTERALKQAIRDANAKLEEDYKSGKITKRKKFNAD